MLMPEAVKMVLAHTSIAIRNILYLTDFSHASDAALPFATAIARDHNAKIYAVHVLVPDIFLYLTPGSFAGALDLQQKWADTEMQHVEAQLSGLPHKALIERAEKLWQALEPRIKQYEIDLIVLGVHGLTAIEKLAFGSTSEQVLRSSTIPMLVAGPAVPMPLGDTCSHRILFATDLEKDSIPAGTWAIDLATQNSAHLILLHVLEQKHHLSVAEAMHHLWETVPSVAGLRSRPEVIIEYGEPATRILETAKEKSADLIVLGIKSTGHLFAAAHLESTAHRVMANAECPVLAVPTIQP